MPAAPGTGRADRTDVGRDRGAAPHQSCGSRRGAARAARALRWSPRGSRGLRSRVRCVLARRRLRGGPAGRGRTRPARNGRRAFSQRRAGADRYRPAPGQRVRRGHGSHLERGRGVGLERLRCIYPGGAGDRAGGPAAACLAAWPSPYPAMDQGARVAGRSAARPRAQRAHGRRSPGSPAAAPQDRPSTPGPALRCQRLDGALHADAPVFRACPGQARPASRGLPVLDSVDPHHAAAARTPRRRGARERLADRARLVGRHAHRQRAAAASPALEPSRPRVPSHRPLDLRWVGSRRSGRASPGDLAAQAELPSPRVAQSADWHRGLRATDTRPAGGAAVRRRLPPGAESPQPRGSPQYT